MASSLNIAPLSGEIMSGSRPSGELSTPIADIVDAEFETISRADPDPVAARKMPEAMAHGLDILARAGSAPISRRAGVGFWSLGVLIAAAAFWMSGGHVLFEVAGNSQAAALDGVRVSSLTTRVAKTASGEHLVIDGELQNPTGRMATAPDLEIEVKALGGGATRYRLGNGGEAIAAGQALRFSSRLAAPATGVRSVSVSVARIEGS